MNDKKSLDRLFQEKFKDFESEPDPQVWKNIEAALKEKDDRKVIPFWWKLSGVAAVLLLGLFSWNLISDNVTPSNGVVIEQNNVNPTANTSKNDALHLRCGPVRRDCLRCWRILHLRCLWQQRLQQHHWLRFRRHLRQRLLHLRWRNRQHRRRLLQA